ncbi:MAG: purine-nucleoside phosphorylase [Bacteroidales bacterium]|jgi:purine-nucleoside phosphorylase
MLDRIKETADYIQARITVKPVVGIILGTGIGGLVDEIEVIQTISYSTIPNFPIPTVDGHKGNLLFGRMGGKDIVVMQGRFHYYEGFTMQEIAFPVRVMKLLGIRLLILSNASGGVNPEFSIGDLMVIEDHINLIKDNPLIGHNDEKLGTRFPDMGHAYDKELILKVLTIADKHNLPLKKGVYAAVSGPTFETPAEYKYIRTIGADAVGMSTVPEVIVARHMGLRCLAFAMITDLGVPGKIVTVTHLDVIHAASLIEPKMTKILIELLEMLEFPN